MCHVPASLNLNVMVIPPDSSYGHAAVAVTRPALPTHQRVFVFGGRVPQKFIGDTDSADFL